MAGFADAERVLKPHHRWHYSNLVYAMLGEVIARLEDVTGSRVCNTGSCGRWG